MPGAIRDCGKSRRIAAATATSGAPTETHWSPSMLSASKNSAAISAPVSSLKYATTFDSSTSALSRMMDGRTATTFAAFGASVTAGFGFGVARRIAIPLPKIKRSAQRGADGLPRSAARRLYTARMVAGVIALRGVVAA
jgi:hypothetical protein